MPSCDSASCASLRCGAKSALRIRVEHRVVGPLGRRHAHAERDPARDLAHDPPRRRRARRGRRGVSSVCDRLVAAADVVADAGRRDVALVGDAAADRLAVARVVVGAEHAELGVAGRHAALELLEAARVDVAEGLDRAHRSLLSYCRFGKTPGGVEPPERGLQPRASPLGHGGVRCGLQPRAGRSTRTSNRCAAGSAEIGVLERRCRRFHLVDLSTASASADHRADRQDA